MTENNQGSITSDDNVCIRSLCLFHDDGDYLLLVRNCPNTKFDSRIIIARIFGGYARRTCRIEIHFSPLGETSEYSIRVKILI